MKKESNRFETGSFSQVWVNNERIIIFEGTFLEKRVQKVRGHHRRLVIFAYMLQLKKSGSGRFFLLCYWKKPLMFTRVAFYSIKNTVKAVILGISIKIYIWYMFCYLNICCIIWNAFKAELSVLSVTSFRNPSNMLLCLLKNISYNQCWKLFRCLIFLWKLINFFQDYLINRKVKRTAFIGHINLCSNVQIFTVTWWI